MRSPPAGPSSSFLLHPEISLRLTIGKPAAAPFFGWAIAILLLFLSTPHAFSGELAERDGVWAQTYSDLTADPDVRFGQLANGMRYAIMRNTTPPGQVSIRFRIATGSFAETDAQQGLAHFLEHMAFKGSTHVPEGEMIKMLQRLGLAFGPDTNAYTSTDETVYMFDLPKADAEAVDTGLSLTRETASELTLSASAMDQERGVILSEERLRDTPGYHVAVADTAFLLPGQLAADRFPIGKVDVIKNAPVSELSAYYRAHYRPERATLIVAGDIDADAIEAKIKTLFSSWSNPTPALPAPDLGSPKARGTEARVMVQPGTALEIDLDWVNPYDNAADTAAIRRRDTIRGIGLKILNRRLNHAAQQPQPPFQRASVSRGNSSRSADIAELAVFATPATWQQALVAAETLRRQAVIFGVRQDEVDTAIVESRTARKAAVDSAPTRRSPQLASALAGAAQGNNVFTSPAQNLALFEDHVKNLSAADVSVALKDVFQGSGPLVFAATPEPIQGGEGALLAAFERAESAPLTAAVAEAEKAWPYSSFGSSGQVVERRTVDDLGVTFIRFANGVRLTVKPTTFTRDQILVNVLIGSGLQSLPRDRMTALWAGSALVSGGLKDLSQEDIQKLFREKVVSANFGAGEDAFELSGTTRKADLESQMQLLAAHVTAPGFRPEAFERIRVSLQTRLERITATPAGVLGHSISQLNHSGDLSWKQPDRADLDSATLSDLQEILQEPLSHGKIEVVMAGDVTVDQAVGAVAATFGALPPRPSPVTDTSQGATVRFPDPKESPPPLEHTGRDDQAIAVLAWRTDDFFANPQRARAVRLAEQILRIRLTEQFRMAEGNTYSPATDFEASQTFAHYGFVMARVETPPAKIARFFEEAAKIAADMGRKGVSEDELQRALRPRIEALSRAQQTNGYWAGSLAGAQTDPRKLEAIRMTVPGLQKVTRADIQKAAALYFVEGRAWKLSVAPRKSP